MRVYISGPITRATGQQLAGFYLAQREIEGRNHNAINPHLMAPYALTWETYMAIAQTIINSGDVDAILMLKGWKSSRGACVEKVWADARGIPVYYQDPTE